jgi:hypothetical protein
MVRIRIRALLAAARPAAARAAAARAFPARAVAARAAVALAACALAAASPARAQQPGGIVVIVNAAVPAARLTRADVRRLFLLRERFWPDGERVAPVNAPAGSPLRERFSRAVLGGTSRSFSTYWNDLYFHGTPPPPTLASEQAVLLYVGRTAGAIGYLSEGAAAALPADVRVVLTVSP